MLDDRFGPGQKIRQVYLFILHFHWNEFGNHPVPPGNKNFLTVFNGAHDIAEMMLKVSYTGFYHVLHFNAHL